MVSLLVVNAVAGERGYIEVQRAEKRYAEALAGLRAQRAENESLRDRIRRLKSDPAAIEAEIRRQLGYARPGEVVFTIRDVPSAPATTSTPGPKPVPER